MTTRKATVEAVEAIQLPTAGPDPNQDQPTSELVALRWAGKLYYTHVVAGRVKVDDFVDVLPLGSIAGWPAHLMVL